MFDGAWPFAVVPTADRARMWAGRPTTRSQLEAMVARWKRRNTSEIAVMWADFGQGKTHSLMYLDAQIEGGSTLTHYVQLPPLTSGSPFVALYRQLMRDFPLDQLGNRVYAHFRHSPNELTRAGSPSTRPLLQLLWLIGTNAPGQDVATRWLRADKVTAKDVDGLVIAGKRLAVGPAPNTAQECQNVLDALLAIVTDFPIASNGQAVLFIDEFQRIGELPPRKRVEVCDALHLLFNKHPTGLRMVLAFAGGMPEIVDHVLTLDLLSRVNSRIDLPPLSLADGRDYLSALLQYLHAESRRYGPFESEAVDAVLDLVSTDGETSPRRINIGFDLVTNAVLDRWLADDHDQSAMINLLDVQRAIPGVRTQLQSQLDTYE